MQNYKLLRVISYSLLAHILLIVIFVSSPILSSKKYFKTPAIKTRLVKLGKKRDEKLLPRKLMKKEKIINVKKKSQVKKLKKTKKTRKAKKILKKSKNSQNLSLSDRLTRVLKKTQDSGRFEGAVFGESIEGDLADSYNLRIQALIKENYRIPAVLNKAKLDNLEIQLILKIDSSGKPVLVSVSESSGNKLYDNAVLVGTKNIASFGEPPILLRRKYLRQGVKIVLCPIKCKES